MTGLRTNGPGRPPSPVALLLLAAVLGLPVARRCDAQDEAASDLTPSRIEGATLYSRLARVTRTVAAPAEEGVGTVRLGPLPALLSDPSVRAEGDDHLRVLSVQVERRAGGDRATPAFLELEARIEDLAAERERVDRRRRAAQLRRERFSRLEVSAPPRPEDKTEPLPVDPAAWQNFIDLVAQGMSRADAEIAELSVDIDRRDRELRQLREQLATLASPGRRETTIAIVTVQNTTGAPGTLRVSYEVHAALWYPEYAVRIDPAARSLEVTCYGVVHQRTGEDWPEVPIRFSTSIPEQGATMPELASVRLRRDRYDDLALAAGIVADERGRWANEDSPVRRRGVPNQTQSANPLPVSPPMAEPPAEAGTREFGSPLRIELDLSIDRHSDLDKAANVLAELENSLENLESISLGTLANRPRTFVGIPPGCILPSESSRGFLRTFESARAEAVPGDGAPHRLLIERIEIPFLEERIAVPELAERIYRSLRAALPGEDPLLDGRAAVFLDGAYLGISRVPTTAPGEEIVVDLGVDERIQVERKQEDREEEVGVFSKSRRYHTDVTVELVNLHDEAKEVRVRERMPFSENEKLDIVLEDRGTSPDPDAVGEANGLLSWTILLPPGEKRTVTLRYRIDAPRDYQLTRTPAPERMEESR